MFTDFTGIQYHFGEHHKQMKYFKWHSILHKKHLHKIHNHQNCDHSKSSQAHGSVHADLIERLKQTGRLESWAE